MSRSKKPWTFIFRWFSSTSRTHQAIDEEATSTASPALAHLPDRADKENCAPSQVKSSLNANVVRVARKSSLFNVTKNSSQQVAADPQEQIIPAERAQSRAFVSAVVPSRRYTSESSRTLAHMRKENHRLTRKKEELTRKLEILRQIPEQNEAYKQHQLKLELDNNKKRLVLVVKNDLKRLNQKWALKFKEVKEWRETNKVKYSRQRAAMQERIVQYQSFFDAKTGQVVDLPQQLRDAKYELAQLEKEFKCVNSSPKRHSSELV